VPITKKLKVSGAGEGASDVGVEDGEKVYLVEFIKAP
jgi:hypothetical protein